MALYHINYEGKILPCRAKVKKCPYEESRHGSSYEELYPVAMSHYNSVPTDENLVRDLQNGKTLTDLSPISDQLETSVAPMESMINTLGLALKNVDKGKIPQNLAESESKATGICYDLYSENLEPPKFVPKYIRDKAYSEWVKNGKQVVRHRSDVSGQTLTRANEELTMIEDEVNQAYEWRRTHANQSAQFRKDYAEGLRTDYNAYSKALNTSKMLTQPTWASGKSTQEIETNLKGMMGVELLSLYDDLTLSDKELNESLEEVNHFRYNRRSDLSDKANDNVENWYRRNQVLAKRHKVASSQRLLLSIHVAKELMSRDIAFGDFIKNTET